MLNARSIYKARRGSSRVIERREVLSRSAHRRRESCRPASSRNAHGKYVINQARRKQQSNGATSFRKEMASAGGETSRKYRKCESPGEVWRGGDLTVSSPPWQLGADARWRFARQRRK